jgi:hypothetical protein
MPEKILDQVMNVVDNIPEDFPYDTLKSRLLQSHTLSDHEKLEILYKSEPLVCLFVVCVSLIVASVRQFILVT